MAFLDRASVRRFSIRRQEGGIGNSMEWGDSFWGKEGERERSADEGDVDIYKDDG